MSNSSLADVYSSGLLNPVGPTALQVFKDITINGNVYFYSYATDFIPKSPVSLRYSLIQYSSTSTTEVVADPLPGEPDHQVYAQGAQSITSAMSTNSIVLTDPPTLGTIPSLPGTYLIWKIIPTVDVPYTFAPSGGTINGLPATLAGTSSYTGSFYRASMESYGLLGIDLNSLANPGATKYSLGYFPGFTGTTDWYSQLDYASHIKSADGSFVDTAYTLTSFDLDPYDHSSGGMPYEYQSFGGFQLTSQTSSSRVWTRGEDSIAVTLSVPFDLSSHWAGSGFENVFEFGACFIVGQSTAGPFNSLEIPSASNASSEGVNYNGFPVASGPDGYDQKTFVPTTGKALLIGSDGTWSLETVTIPGGTLPYHAVTTAVGTLTVLASGQIVAAVKGWNNPASLEGQPIGISGGLLFSDF